MPKSALTKTEQVKVASLIPYPSNPKKHPDEQIALIAGSIKEFGFLVPLVIDAERGIVAGHGRYLAAKKLELIDVPCIRAEHLSPAQIKAFRIADNKSAESAWDEDLLKIELDDLVNLGVDLSLTGFEDFNGNGDLPDAPEPQIDKAEELQEKWKVVRGQIWEVGKHRVMCGDATDEGDVEALLGGNEPRLLITDPPYGVNYDPSWRQDAADKGLIGFSPSRMGKVSNDDRMDWSDAWRLLPCNVAYVWHAGRYGVPAIESLEATGFEVRAQLIWVKPSFAISRGHYNWQHEPCWYAVRKGRKSGWIGDHSQSTIWEIARPGESEGNTGHGTQKPVGCMARPIRNHEGDVCDPFLGSGTTMVAAEQLGRKCYGMEIEPKYVAVTLERMADMGLKPELVSSPA